MKKDAGLSVAYDAYEKSYQAVKNKINVMELELPDTTTEQEGGGGEGGSGNNDEGRHQDGCPSPEYGGGDENGNTEYGQNLGGGGGGAYFSDDGDSFNGDHGRKGKGRAGRATGAGRPKPGSREGQTCKHCKPPATAK